MRVAADVVAPVATNQDVGSTKADEIVIVSGAQDEVSRTGTGERVCTRCAFNDGRAKKKRVG